MFLVCSGGFSCFKNNLILTMQTNYLFHISILSLVQVACTVLLILVNYATKSSFPTNFIFNYYLVCLKKNEISSGGVYMSPIHKSRPYQARS